MTRQLAFLFGMSLLLAGVAGRAEATTTSVPFWATITCSTAQSECTKSIKVPAANHWIIQTVTGFCTQTTKGGNAIYEIYLATTASKESGAVFFNAGPASQVQGGIAEAFSTTGSPLAYADPGSTVVFAAIEALQSPLSCTVYLSGQSTTP